MPDSGIPLAPAFGGDPILPYVNQQAEATAYDVLEAFDIREPPIDPIAMAQDIGIEVWASALGDDVAGLLVKKQRGAPEIYLNVNDHPNRQRFTCAHELGHFYARKLDGSDDDWNYVDYRDDLSSKGADPDERFANGFAAALLMPRAMLAQHLHLPKRQIARLFQVSQIALEHRLDNLSLRAAP